MLQHIELKYFLLALALCFGVAACTAHAATYAIGGTMLEYQGCISGSWTNGNDTGPCSEPGIWINAYRPTGSVTVPDTATTGASYSVTISQSMSSYAGQAGVPARTYCNDGGADYVCGPNNIAAVFYRNLPAPSGAPYNSLPSAATPGAVTIPGTATLVRTVAYPSPNQTFSLTAPATGTVDRLGIIQRPDAVSYVRCGIDVDSARENCWTYQWGYSSVDVTLVPAPAAPATPTGLTVSPGSCGGRLNISWNASVGATSYELSRDGGAWISVGNVTSYTATGLISGQSYAYRVRAVNGGGPSGPSASINGTASAPCPPVACTPDNSFYSWNGLNWDDYSATGPNWTAGSFAPAYGTSNQGGSIAASTYLNGYPISGVTARSTNGYPSPAETLTCDSVPAPAIPSGVTVTPGACGTGQMTVAWGTVAGATSYTVRRGGTVLATTTALNHIDSGLTASTSYSYTVRSNGPGGSSSYSSPSVTATTAGPCPYPNLTADPATVVPASVQAGGTVTLTATIHNIGTATSGPHNLSPFNIDSDGNFSVWEHVTAQMARQTGSIPPGGSYTRSIVWTVPATATPGTTYRTKYFIDTSNEVFEGAAGEAGNFAVSSYFTVTNQSPVVSAGSDRSITLPIADAAPSGASASDPHGVSTLWTFVSGPGPTPTLTNETTLTPSFSGMTTAGVYTFRLTAQDPYGASSQDTMTVTVTGGSCASQTTANCVLPNGTTGQSAGSCGSGFDGGCAYTCDGATGTWTLTSNTCSGPIITQFEACLWDGSVATSCGTTLTVATGTPLAIRWAATNADSCTRQSGPADFETGSAASGMDTTVTSGATPGVALTYTLVCTKDGQAATADTTVSTVNVNAAGPELDVNSAVVHVDDTVTLTWDTNNGNESLCSLSGGGLTDATLDAGGGGTNETGSVTTTIVGRTTFVIACPNGTNVRTVDILPEGWET